MQVFHERTFRIRHYECDAYGHVNHANYVRYMQETAFDASASVGFDIARYEQLGLFWLVRETDITYLRPLIYGDSVIVKTWVEDFRRVHSRRAYELRCANSNELVAQASTDWVLLSAKDNRLAHIPEEMVQAFVPSRETEKSPPRERFPKAPPPPKSPFTVQKTVGWRDLDPAVHVNNAMYLSFMEDVGGQAVAHYGWALSRLLAENIGVVVRRFRIEYKVPAVLDDELEITTYLSDVKRATAVRHYIIRRPKDDVLIARAHVLNVCIDLTTGLPRKFPVEFLHVVQDNVV